MDEDKIYRDALGRFQAEKENREREQREQRQAAEVELLDGAVNMREFIERREALPHLVLEPDIPMDEMSVADYMKMRDRQRPSYAHSDFAELLKVIELEK